MTDNTIERIKERAGAAWKRDVDALIAEVMRLRAIINLQASRLDHLTRKLAEKP